MAGRAVIVGTDGTDCGTVAVDWAAAEAQRRGLPLRIVHAFDWDWHESRFDIGNEYIDVARVLADAVVAAAYGRAREAGPDLEIETDTLLGHAVPRLLEVSRGAELLVLGSRGRGGFAGLLLGSVSRRVATHASCPVAVVRGPGNAGGPVTVGVDDSSTAEQVLQTAFEAAAARSCALVVVRSFLPAVPHWLAGVTTRHAPTPQEDDAEISRLAELLEPWRHKFPAVPVGTVLTNDSAAGTLVAASLTAQLVVVGSGRHPAAAALLGSTSMQLLQHAECPVLIARPDTAEEASR